MIKAHIEYNPTDNHYYVFSIYVREMRNGVEVNSAIHMVDCSRTVFEYSINPDSDAIEIIFEEHEIYRKFIFPIEDVPDDFKFGIRFSDIFDNDDEPSYVHHLEYGDIPYLHPLLKYEVVDYYSI